jgi:hypothetical protein
LLLTAPNSGGFPQSKKHLYPILSDFPDVHPFKAVDFLCRRVVAYLRVAP